MNAKQIKNFKNLKEEVHNKGICQICGGCVSFCSSADFEIIGFDQPDEPPIYINEEACLECGICYHICPQTKVMDNDLDSRYNNKPPIGNYYDIFSCQATDKDILAHGTDGGVVSAILLYLLEHKLIDGAIVSKKIGPFTRDSMVAYSKDDLIKSAGSFFDVSPQVTEIANYSTYSPTILALNLYKFKKLAVIGTPCQIHTIRCMQELGVTPAQNIKYVLGLFCNGNFQFKKDEKEKFEDTFNFKLDDIDYLNVKEGMIIKLKGNSEKIEIPIEKLKGFMRNACNACNDFTNVFADISFGGLGSAEKYTTTVPRTKLGKDLIASTLSKGYIKNFEMQEAEKNSLLKKLVQFSQQKKERYDLFHKDLEHL